MSLLRPVIRRLLLFTGLAALLVYLGAFVAVVVASRQDQRRPADAIVVLGAAQYNGKPSPVLKARLDHGVELYRAGLAPVVVVTGGIGDGDRESEATVSRRYLVSNGVPLEAVVVRPEGRSTEASMMSVAAWLKDHDHRRVLLVSDPFHMCRLRLEARRMGIEPYSSPTATSPISANLRLELPYLASEALKIPVAWIRSW